MTYRARTLMAAVATTLALTSLGTVAPAAALATPNTCGGAISDYTGTTTPPVPFKGELSVTVDAVTSKYAVTVTSQAPNSNILQVNVTLPSGQDVSTTSSFTLDVDNLGKGAIRFGSPTGVALSKGVLCESTLLGSRTRVTKITGKMTDPTPGVSTLGDFTISRPAL
ncbi:hypothetical protein [Streptomyces sp. WM6368]|uniref:hypothetical protein n=1 Tax=Streptomyces sp. WM6368 TaxID=1415554 RepID=UPI0006AE36ED|nr:hypothetical protein [Streptomyces sp. WM6368]KOU37184.1 hypothetical protein ADK51_00835 [Streptomyces sp. WM6368]